MDKVPIIRHGKTLAVTADECKYNTRIKLYPCNSDCEDWYAVDKMVCNNYVFNPDNAAVCKRSEHIPIFSCDERYTPDKDLQERENKQRAIRRAKAKLFDYIRCNLDLNYFVTLTFNPDLINSKDYAAVIKKVNQWLDNRVRRNGLKYCGVVERHKKGGLHFHFMTNDKLFFVDSGTVKVPKHKKPIKRETAAKYKIPWQEWQTVWNVFDWDYGFSTAIKIIDDDLHIKTSHYLVKYLTKDFEKIGGRYYYSGGKLVCPRYQYSNTDFSQTEEAYAFEVCGIKYKVEQYVNSDS